MRYILGVDPGQTTGLALIECRNTGATLLRATREVPLLGWSVLDLGVDPDVVAIETWEYQGQLRARGVAHQAYAAGVAMGRAHGHTIVTMTRTQVLAAVGLQRGRSGRFKAVPKRMVAEWMAKLLGGEEAARSEHEWDAVAVAVAVAGRTP